MMAVAVLQLLSRKTKVICDDLDSKECALIFLETQTLLKSFLNEVPWVIFCIFLLDVVASTANLSFVPPKLIHSHNFYSVCSIHSSSSDHGA